MTGPITAFAGRRAQGRPPAIAGAAAEKMEGRWSAVSRYSRRAMVVAVETLTSTGTIRLRLRVVDGQPFRFRPGNFVGIECFVDGLGYRRSPYCIVSPPADDGCFDLLVRIVPDGPLSQYLAALAPGDEITFRGPVGRAMVRDADPDPHDLVLLATGVGVGPFYALAASLLADGFDRQIHLFWGLRSAADICLVDELDALEDAYPNFRYDITLSQPDPDWPGPRGRLTESVPPALDHLGGTRFLLCGNGDMIAELREALAAMGVEQKLIYDEPYFNGHHVADPATVAAICDRFAADDVRSPFAPGAAGLFHLEGSLRRPSAA